MRRRVPSGVHSSGVLPEPVHPPAGKAYTRRAIACSICWTEQQRDPLLPFPPLRLPPRRLHQNDYVCGVTRVRARLHTRALELRSGGGWKLTETGKLALRNGASRRYRARNRPLAHDRGQCRGSRVPNNRLLGIDRQKRLLIQLGAPPLPANCAARSTSFESYGAP